MNSRQQRARQRLQRMAEELESFEVCGDCSGSGEGWFDGSTCATCGGLGEVPAEEREAEEADA